MKTQKSILVSLLLVPLFLSFGCGDAPEGWSPVLEETSTGFLETETERLQDQVRSALEHLESDPVRAASDLRSAEASLEHLLNYYLPLFKAREGAYNALRSLYLRDLDRVDRELTGIERILEGVAEKADGQRLMEIESLAEALADSRMATASSSTEEGREALEGLARRLDQAVLKGDLILVK